MRIRCDVTYLFIFYRLQYFFIFLFPGITSPLSLYKLYYYYYFCAALDSASSAVNQSVDCFFFCSRALYHSSSFPVVYCVKGDDCGYILLVSFSFFFSEVVHVTVGQAVYFHIIPLFRLITLGCNVYRNNAP
jgi:hypothetical protein